MCVTCLGNNQHTHSSHRSCSVPIHNLYKHKNIGINTLVLNGNHRHVCMYENGKFISHTKSLGEEIVFVKPCCLEVSVMSESIFSYLETN
jgi:hypothetical protein